MQYTKNELFHSWGGNSPTLLGLPRKQPRLILFMEALEVKGALVVKRDGLEMRWRVPLGA